MSELKPCPFCGCKEAQVLFYDDDDWFVQCLRPPGECPVSAKIVGCRSEEGATAAWNKRADAAVRLKTLREARERLAELLTQPAFAAAVHVVDYMIAEEEAKS